jgi:hypothetical protein
MLLKRKLSDIKIIVDVCKVCEVVTLKCINLMPSLPEMSLAV